MGGRIDVTNQEVDNLERRVIDLEGKLVKLAALEAAFDHFTNEHWICQGHSTLSSQRVFEGARLTQLVQLVTAGRLFPCHKGWVDS